MFSFLLVVFPSVIQEGNNSNQISLTDHPAEEGGSGSWPKVREQAEFYMFQDVTIEERKGSEAGAVSCIGTRQGPWVPGCSSVLVTVWHGQVWGQWRRALLSYKTIWLLKAQNSETRLPFGSLPPKKASDYKTKHTVWNQSAKHEEKQWNLKRFMGVSLKN